MESIAIFDSLRFEKVKDVLCYNRLLLLVELCAALLVLCWCSSRLPLALQWISGLLAGHVFSFVVSNAIILTILANSGWLSAADSPNSISEILSDDAAAAEEVEMIPVRPNPAAIDGGESSDLEFPKALMRRTKSEVKYPSEEGDCKGAVLRRSETCCREMMSAGYGGGEEEEMSNEEFQRAIEAFIAKQLKFRRQESISGVVETYS